MCAPNRQTIPTTARSTLLPGCWTQPCSLRSGGAWTFIFVCLIVLIPAVGTLGQDVGDEGTYDQVERPGFEQLDRLNEALWWLGTNAPWIGLILFVLIALVFVRPRRLYAGVKERLLIRAVRDVDPLLKRIQKDAETISVEPQEDTIDEGLLGAMAEVAEFSKAEHVPAYVLTVNDRMLDNVRVALKRLRTSKEGDAERYRAYLFSVLKGMKIIAADSAESKAASGLAVNLQEYFKDDGRYKAWRRLLSRFAKKGDWREICETFLLFMKNLREDRPIVVPAPAPEDKTTVLAGPAAPEIPDVVNERTLPLVQQAAALEAKRLIASVGSNRPLDQEHAWQFELVRRQTQVHLRDDARKMLSVFLSCERKALREIAKMAMLPCGTWGHVLYMLGAESGSQVLERIKAGQLTIQEILLLEKAFLQTFAKKESLRRVYGRGDEAQLMMDAHLPQIRRNALFLLRKAHETEPKRLSRATEALNEEESPAHNEVKKLIEHYVHHGHNLPTAKPKPRPSAK